MIITKLDMIVLDMIVHDIGHKPADAMRRAVERGRALRENR